jgi:hypothetical protein
MQRRADRAWEGLAIDVDLPAGLLIECHRKAELGKTVVPDGQEIIEGLIVSQVTPFIGGWAALKDKIAWI